MRFHPLARLEEMIPGWRRSFTVSGLELLLVVDGDSCYLVEALCPHMGSRLDAGTVRDGRIRCPHHLYLFDMESGSCLTEGVICDSLRCLPTEQRDGWVGVDLNLLADWL